MHRPALGQLAEQELFGQRLFDMLLNDSSKRTRAISGLIAFIPEPFLGFRRKFERHAAISQLRLKLQHEFFNHTPDGFRRQRLEGG